MKIKFKIKNKAFKVFRLYPASQSSKKSPIEHVKIIDCFVFVRGCVNLCGWKVGLKGFSLSYPERPLSRVAIFFA